MSTFNKYRVPVPKHMLQRIDKTSSPAHVGKLRNAIDLIVPKDTPVLASPSYWEYTNFISIMHPYGEYTRYDHLEYRSSKVRVGQNVHAGQEIARVGMTGYTYIPHLHFHVFVFTGYNIWTDFDTLEVKYFI